MQLPQQGFIEIGAQPPLLMATPERISSRHIRTLILLLLTTLGVVLCYQMAAPFLPAIALAVTLAVLFVTLQVKLERRLKHPSVAAFISVLAIAVVVVGPAIFVGQQLVLQAASGAQAIESQVSSGEWRQALEEKPRLALIVERVERQIDLPGAIRSLTLRLSSTAAAVIKGSIFHLLGFAITFYLLFFFLRDRRVLLDALSALSPLTTLETKRLFSRVDDTLHATIYGTLAVAAIQGVLGGLIFWWLGLPGPLLWGVVMALLAIVPVLGAFLVWIPAALFLLLDGSWEKALILALWGALVVGTVDNLLRPVLVGRRLKQHTVLAFLSVVGGLIVFGAAGLILGPVTLTITTALLEIWPRRTGAPT